MKVGTKFKLECEVRVNPGWTSGLAVYTGGQPIVLVASLTQYHKDGIVDIREPRRRFTDVDGTEYEVLVDGDKWEDGDVMHNRLSGVREKATVCVGSKVYIGPNYKIGLRKVKA